jgi:hypothetical protein
LLLSGVVLRIGNPTALLHPSSGWDGQRSFDEIIAVKQGYDTT